MTTTTRINDLQQLIARAREQRTLAYKVRAPKSVITSINNSLADWTNELAALTA